MTKPMNKKVFLKKLNAMLNDPGNEKYIKWDEGSNAIIIPNKEKFTEKVLPKRFNHKNFSSFVRQLNSYGFNKRKDIKNCLTYENKNFYKNMTDEDLENFEVKKNQEKKIKLISINNESKNSEITRNLIITNSVDIKENDNETRIKLNKCLDDLKLLLDNQEKIFKDIELLKSEQKNSKSKKTEEPKENKNYLNNSIKIELYNNVNDLGNNYDINNFNVHNSYNSINQDENNMNQNTTKINNDNFIKNGYLQNLTTSYRCQNIFKK